MRIRSTFFLISTSFLLIFSNYAVDLGDTNPSTDSTFLASNNDIENIYHRNFDTNHFLIASGGYGRLFSKYAGITAALTYRYEQNSMGLDSTFSFLQGWSSDVYQLGLSLCSFYKFGISKSLIGRVGLGPGFSSSKLYFTEVTYHPGNQFYSYASPPFTWTRIVANKYYSLDTTAFIQVSHALKKAPINSLGFTARAIQPAYFLHTKIKANHIALPKYPTIFLSMFIDY